MVVGEGGATRAEGRDGTSSAVGAVTASSPLCREALYTETWGTQVFVAFGGGGTECKFDFKESIWLKLEAMGPLRYQL